MEVRKVFRAGNSFAVSIPADWVRDMHLEDQPVEVSRNDKGEIVVRPLKELQTGLTLDFMHQTEDFMSEYGDVLKV